jgi:hypothetical protein
MDSIIGERALREIYLKPFQIALKNSDPWALMTSYNRVNGVHASESQRLLQDILIKEWGFKGLVMSDWTGTVSTVEAILAGQDLEMPGTSSTPPPLLYLSRLVADLFLHLFQDPLSFEVRLSPEHSLPRSSPSPISTSGSET